MAREERISLPSLTPGTTRHLQVRRYGAPGARPKVYIQGSIHADEMPGSFCIHHMTPLLQAAEQAGEIHGEIVVVPFANPIGLAQDVSGDHLGRFDLASRENYNRGYPWLAPAVAARIGGRLGGDAEVNVGLIRQAALDCLADASATTDFGLLRIALMGLAIDSDYCFDLHSAGEATLYLYCDSDPGDDSVAQLAADMKSPATFIQASMHEGRPFSASVGQLWDHLAAALDDPAKPVPVACFSATIELRGGRAIDDAVSQGDAANLFRFLQRRGVIGGAPGPLPELLYQPQPITACDHGYAPKTGILVHQTAVGDRVEKGDVVAIIVDPLEADFDAARTPIESPASGILFDRQAF